MMTDSARQFGLAGLTGLLLPLCFPDYNFGWLAWIALVPLHLALDGPSGTMTPRRALWLGWLAGFLAFTGIMSWVVTAMHQYGKMPLIASYPVMWLLAAYLGLYVGLYVAAFAWLMKRLPAAVVLGAPCLWVSLELIRAHFLSGFPWMLLGYSQYQWLPIIQIADITSVYGVSFLIVLTNVALASLILWAWRRFRLQQATAFPWPAPAATAIVLIASLVYGQATLSHAPGSDDQPSVAIGLIQPNIDQAHKWDQAYRRDTLDRYATLTAKAAKDADLVLWPEAATPFFFEEEPLYRVEVAVLAHRHGVPLLFGSPALRRYPNGRPYLLNSAYLLSPDGQIVGRYDKRHLVPFGEYIPLHSSVLFFLEKLVEGIGDFEAGTKATVFTPAARPGRLQPNIGVVICYEVIFPNLVREFVAQGATVMATITNDAWFGDSSAPYQHFAMVVFRAVENRIAFARSANTGISGLIDPSGRIVQATPIFTEQAVTGHLPLRQTMTFYTRYGDVFAYACAIITAVFGIVADWRRSHAR
ncbi:MAG: apolipoprotein N-acyltransferase [Nitrospiraceae bacterium]|nr:apolipoprotein N-acyltransferase [Nitrospiraceae bacterium]MSR23666.1 apolipoprotein N-acyltransferase [Nitrospiraceae bacterium]